MTTSSYTFSINTNKITEFGSNIETSIIADSKLANEPET